MDKHLQQFFKVVSHERRIAQVTLIDGHAPDAAMLSRLAAASQMAPEDAGLNPNPKPEDFIYLPFRALSRVVIPGYWLDYTRPGVLEAAVPLLEGATVYKNHSFWDVEKHLGSVSKSWFDKQGANSGGVPGINCELMIDAVANPRIARGLQMRPPAIHSLSLTVLFEFDFSHPRLVEERKFWINLGEEIDGEIVRLIVTKIREIWEASLVFQGADRIAKQDTSGDTETEEEMEAGRKKKKMDAGPGEATMKLTTEQKQRLGIAHEGEDVPESVIYAAAEKLATQAAGFDQAKLDALQKQAETAETLLTDKRAEVTRLATLAELGAEEGKLEEVITQSIAEATPERLLSLEAYYRKRAAEKLPGRSSQEDAEAVHKAGGVAEQKAKPAPKIKFH